MLVFLEDSDQEDLHSSIILLSARYNRNKSANLNGTIAPANFNLELNRIGNSIQDFVKNNLEEGESVDTSNSNRKEDSSNNASTKKSVFISYSHKESGYALKMKESLEKLDVEVIIDVKDLAAGTDIKSFIEGSIKKHQIRYL